MTTGDSHVYDKAKYHADSVAQAGLPDSHTSNHIVPMLRWLIENDLMSEFFLTEGSEPLGLYRDESLPINDLFEWWDTCLISDMLSDQGNAFAMYYFDYDKGKYIHDYKSELRGDLPSEFHVVYSEDSYSRLKPIIDSRYAQWISQQSKPWWRLW